MKSLLIVLTCILIVFVCKCNTDCGCSNLKRETKERDSLFAGKEKKIEQCNKDECQIENEIKKEENLYDEMVLLPSGNYYIGSDRIIKFEDMEHPMKIVNMKSFYIDKYEVTVGNFRKFVEATGYKTDAEKFNNSFVFQAFLDEYDRKLLEDYRVADVPWWYRVDGADWLHPEGPGSNVEDKDDHPVTHVSWRDAKAYCKWKSKRLPSENEWESACKGPNRNSKFPWGDLLFSPKIHANLWQGEFPVNNKLEDGYFSTNPVHVFPQAGIHNMIGNVWEWTSDYWNKLTKEHKVKKGGSYLCHKSYCHRYRCSSRTFVGADSSAGHLGFRCAKSNKTKNKKK